jgi:predicted transcriptional regulator of viral defense system
MTDLPNKILQYLKTTKEANVYEIQANIDFWEVDPIGKLQAALSKLQKQGLIKKYPNTKYRVVKAQHEQQQINLF